jgi:hypothetical protein
MVGIITRMVAHRDLMTRCRRSFFLRGRTTSSDDSFGGPLKPEGTEAAQVARRPVLASVLTSTVVRAMMPGLAGAEVTECTDLWLGVGLRFIGCGGARPGHAASYCRRVVVVVVVVVVVGMVL